MGADSPTSGDWFVVANVVTGLRAPEGADGIHRFIVKSAWPGPRVTLLPRSTTWAEGRFHEKHGGACGSETCRLDSDARISTDVRHVDVSQLDDFSCTEPDEDVIEWAMSVEPPPMIKRGRR